jgi:hypothetical protein
VAIRAYTFLPTFPNGVELPVGDEELDAELSTPSGDTGFASAPSTPIGTGQVMVAPLYGSAFGPPDDPAAAVVVHSSPRIATIRIQFDNGAADAMKAVDGWAVLAHRGAPSSGELEGLTTDGSVIAKWTVLFSPPQTYSGPLLFSRATSDHVLLNTRIEGRFYAPRVSNFGYSSLAFEGLRLCQLSVPGAMGDWGLGHLGAREQAPVSVIPLVVGPGVAYVKARFDDGFVDSMAPVQGFAVLAHQGLSGSVTVEAYDSEGSLRSVRQVAYAGLDATAPPCGA